MMAPGVPAILEIPITLLAGLALAGGLASAEPQVRPFAGRVVDERRFPVAGASVTVHGVPGAEPIVCTTGSDGRFSFEIPAGAAPAVQPAEENVSRFATFFVTTSDGRVGDATAWLPRTENEENDRLLEDPIVLVPCGRVVVDLADPEGPVADTNVEIRYPRHGCAVTSALTDSGGHAVIDPAPVGRFAVFAKKAGRGRATVETQVASGESSNVRVELRKLRTLEVEVVDTESGEPISGAAVAVMQVTEGPNPGTIRSVDRDEDFVAVPLRSDERGRLELRELESETVLQLLPTAPHYVEAAPDWSVPSGLGDRKSSRTDFPWRRVSAETDSIRIEMERMKSKTLRWRIVPGTAPTPPDGTPLQVRWVDNGWPRASRGNPATRAVVRDGAVEIECELASGRHSIEGFGTEGSRTGWAEASDGLIGELAPAVGTPDLTACFAPIAALSVKLRSPDGTPQRDEVVSIGLESFDRSRQSPRAESKRTDRDGVARFANLRAGRWLVNAGGAGRLVELNGGETSIALDAKAAAAFELIVAFTLDGEHRLPAFWSVWIDGEDRTQRREDPERGDLHLFLRRPAADAALDLHFSSAEWNPVTRRLTGWTGEAPLMVPIQLRRRVSCRAIARIRTPLPSTSITRGSARSRVELERLEDDGVTPTFVQPQFHTDVSWSEQVHEESFDRLDAGTWRLTMPEYQMAGPPTRVEADGPPAVLELDASNVAEVGILWKVPAGESEAFLELETVRLPGRRGDEWFRGEPEWPLAPGGRGVGLLRFDRRSPPPLVILHPYLVGTSRNDSIDLRNPRSSITLHVEVGPLLTFKPEFEGDVPFVHGAFVTLAERGNETKAADRRKAPRRGDLFAMAPPAAGRYRVLIDPVTVAPVDLDDLALDGASRDLGPIRFVTGSTLRIHARATAPFVPPRLRARAIRIDGLPYERVSTFERSLRMPNDPEIAALGRGRFRVILEGIGPFTGRTWTAEAEVDGVHDADLDVVAE